MYIFNEVFITMLWSPEFFCVITGWVLMHGSHCKDTYKLFFFAERNSTAMKCLK